MPMDTNSSRQPTDRETMLHAFVASLPLPTILLEPQGRILAVSRNRGRGALPPGTRPGADLTALVGAAGDQLRGRLKRAIQSTAPVCVGLPTATRMQPFQLWAFAAGSRTLLALQADLQTVALSDRLELKQAARQLKSSLRVSELQRRAISEEASRLQDAAARDGRTGLLNGIAFERRVSDTLAAERPCGALVYLDLNGFKAVNDTHGHQAGDHVLAVVARRLQQTVRDSDHLARLGGDEFAMWLAVGANVTDDQIRRRLTMSVASPIRLHDPFAPLIEVTAAIGIARAPEDGSVLSDLIACADARMYREKASGSRPGDVDCSVWG